MAVQKY